MKPSHACIKTLDRVLALDVSKATVVLFDTLSRRTWTVANQFAVLTEVLTPFADYDLMVCETTGGYERAALDAALAVGLAAHRADAARVKSYIRSLGGAAKTDPIDASWLGRYGQERGASLARWRPSAIDRDAFASLVRHRQHLVADRAETKTRRSAPRAEVLASFLDAQIVFLTDQIAKVDQALAQLLAQNPELAADEARLRAIKGVGPVVARTLIALLPELGQLNRKQAACLAGLAPHPNDSGLSQGRRRTGRGGRQGLRPLMFIAALSAARANPDLRSFAQRLIQQGKPKRLVLTAVARKLVVLANSILKPIPQPIQLT
jgi:transposase